MTRLNERVINLAGRGSDLVALLDSRDWVILWPNGQMTGPSIPQGSVIQTFASDRESIWAIAIVGTPASLTTSSAPSTEPATASASPAPATPATTSATNTAPGDLALFQLDRGTWVWKASLPADVRSDASAAVSMAIVGGRPLVAVADAQGAIHTFQYSSENDWTTRGTISPAEKGPFKLLNAGQAVLWTGGAGGAGSVRVLGDKWSDAVPLKASAEVRQPEARTIASIGGSLRFMFVDNGKIFEQPFKLDGTSVGNAAELSMPAPGGTPYNWPMIVLVMALLVALAGAVFRRSMPTKKPEE